MDIREFMKNIPMGPFAIRKEFNFNHDGPEGFEDACWDKAGENLRYQIDKEILEDVFSEAEAGVVEWSEARDEINECFIKLRGHCESLKAFHTESRLVKLNRDMLNLLHDYHGMGD